MTDRKHYAYVKNSDGAVIRNDDGNPVLTEIFVLTDDQGNVLTDEGGRVLTGRGNTVTDEAGMLSDNGLILSDDEDFVTFNGELVTYNGEPVTYAPRKDRPNLLLKTVIVAGERTSEGQLIEAVALPWFEIIEAIDANPNLAYQLSDRKWEEMIAGAYAQAGFDEVILTPRSADLGRDIIAVKKSLGEIRVIDQVKAYKPGHLVTANDVRALLGILNSDGASKGFITTTSDFAPRLRTDPLITPHMPSRLELINGETLFSNLKAIATRKNSSSNPGK